MIKQKKLIILLILSACILIYAVVHINSKDKVVEPEITWNEQEMNFSRISFFNTQKHKASMAVPEHWEGRYRMKDEGKRVVFLNIDNPQNPRELFVIKMTDNNDEIGDEWSKLATVENVQFVYKLSTGEEKNNKDDSSFNKMIDESRYIFESFKAK